MFAVKFIVTALSAIGASVGDVFAIVLPPYIIALPFHHVAELFLAFGLLHHLIDDVHQLPLEALAAPG